MECKFSIIIPAYNAEKTIERCLNSIISQDYQNYEIILINDGSKDTTDEICLDYSKKYNQIHYISRTNHGVSATRNYGISLSIGEYILFVDSDDYVEDGCFNLLESILSQSTHDLYIFSYKIHNKEKEVLRIRKPFNSYKKSKVTKKISDLICRKYINAPWAKLYKRSIIGENDIRFTENASIGEDRAFNIKYSFYVKSLLISDSIIYNLDVSNENSLSRKKINNLNEQNELTDIDIKYKLESSSLSKKEKKKMTSAINFTNYTDVISISKELHSEKKDLLNRYGEILKACNKTCMNYLPCYTNLYSAIFSLIVKLRLLPVIDLIGWKLSK